MTSIETPEDIAVDAPPKETPSSRLWYVLAFTFVLSLLGLLAWGLKETRAGPVQSGMAPDFSDPGQMYGASPALLQGKIIRGGMGTGMPSWGQIFSEDQTWALTDYLWTFSFQDLKE